MTILVAIGLVALVWLHVGVLVGSSLDAPIDCVLLWPVYLVSWITMRNGGRRT